MSLPCCGDRLAMPAGACFSEDRSERYALWRNWDWGRPVMAAIMLNPSIADEDDLDPTLTRVQRFARAWGFGGMRIHNAFATVSTDPRGLMGRTFDHAPNNAHILDTILDPRVMRAMVGWGSNLDKAALRYRRVEIDALLNRSHTPIFAWRMSKTGQPCHPLYLPASIDPVPYTA